MKYTIKKEPIIIEGIDDIPLYVAVSCSLDQCIEDAYWGELALAADKEKPLSNKATLKFLQID